MNAWDAAAAGVIVTAAASASLPIGATVMLRILRAAFEDVLLVDATFPRQHLAGHDGPIIQVAPPDFHPDPAALNFYRRFRQAGGHLPLFGFDDADMVAALSSEMDAGKSRGLVIYTECEPTIWILEVLGRIPTASLLLRGASGISCAGLPSRGLPGDRDTPKRFARALRARAPTGISRRDRRADK